MRPVRYALINKPILPIAPNMLLPKVECTEAPVDIAKYR
jgi:hypothetical protein